MSNANTWYYGNHIDVSSSTGYWDSWYEAAAYFAVRTNGDTDSAYKITLYGTVWFNEWTGWGSSSLKIDGTSKVTNAPIYSPVNSQISSGWATNGPWSKDIDITKTTSQQTKKYTITTFCGGGGWSSVELSITVPAKTSYTISYNANGGSGAPENQTKWYGDTLTLSSTVPTLTGYKFLGWSTSSTSTSATYSAGGSYTANSGATLYAVWEPQAPSIDSAKDINLGESAEIKWTPILTPSYYKVKLEIGEWSYIDSSYTTASNTDPKTWTHTVPIAGVANQITTSSFGTMTATLYTYSSQSEGSLLGSTTRTFTVTVPSASTKPSIGISNITTLDDGNNIIYNIFGVGNSSSNTFFIKGMSTVRAIISLTTGSSNSTNLKYGATLKSVQLEVGTGIDYTSNKLSTTIVQASSTTSATVISNTLNPIISSGTQNVRLWYKITVTDSRSFTATYSDTYYPDINSPLFIQNYWTPSGSITYSIDDQHSISTVVTWDAASLQNSNNPLVTANILESR